MSEREWGGGREIVGIYGVIEGRGRSGGRRGVGGGVGGMQEEA